MADTTANSLTEHITPIAAGAHVIGVAFLGNTRAFALADGQVLLLDAEGQEKRLAPHPDAGLLCLAASGKELWTGGDDGRVMKLSEDGKLTEIAHTKGKWIDALAVRQDGVIAWSTAKQVFVREPKGEPKTFAAPSSVRGLAFAPKGLRLGMAHYNGATLWFPNTAAPPEFFEWKGSHLDISISPDGRFLITSMQENCLHGWRLTDKQDLRMTGYPAKPRSLAWSSDSNWLATSGAEACIVWPFNGKDGPMNKPPRECGARKAKVSIVTFHPKALVVAIGYEDGWILLCRLTDAAEILVRGFRQGAEGAITAMTWNAGGTELLYGTADGQAGFLTMPL